MAAKKKKTTVQIYNEKVLVTAEAIEDRMNAIISGELKAEDLQVPIRVKGEYGSNWIRPTDTERDHTLLAQCILDSTVAADLSSSEFSFLHTCLRVKRLTESQRDRYLFKLANKHLKLTLAM